MTEWMTEAEGAVYLKIPEKTLRWQRYRGKVPYCKIGSIVQYKVSDLDKLRESSWAENQKDSSCENSVGRPSGTSPFPQTAEARDTARIKRAVKKLKGIEPNISLRLVSSSRKKANSQLATA